MPEYIVAKSITNVDWCWLITGWCWLIVLDTDWCWLMLIDADWCWLTLIEAEWCWLMLIDTDWCWLVLIDADWCWLMLINAQIRFNRVFFCRSVPPEFLRSFLGSGYSETSRNSWRIQKNQKSKVKILRNHLWLFMSFRLFQNVRLSVTFKVFHSLLQYFF